MSDRILAKSRKRRLAKRRWRLIQSLFFVVILASSGFLLLQSSLFNIKQIKVSGIVQLQEKEIRDLAALGIGENIFKINLEAAEQRISLNPLVKRVVLERKYPANILIDIEERRPIGIIPIGEGFMEVDEQGVLLKKLDQLVGTNLPLITGLKLKKVTPGSKIDSKNLSAAVQYINVMPERLAKQISEINVTNRHQVIIYTVTSAQIRLGSPEKIEEKMKLLNTALKNSAGKEIEYIDISYEGQPVFKLKEGVEN